MMSTESRTEQLVQAYLDGALSPTEAAELSKLLVDDPRAAEVFARATRFEDLLRTHLVEEKRAGEWSLGPAGAGEAAAAGDVAKEVVAPPAPRLRRPIAVAAVVAAGFVTAAALVLALRWWPVEQVAPALVHRIVAGRVLVDGVEAETFVDGARLEVLGSSSATIHLADGNDFELMPATMAVVRDDGREAIVRLDYGNAKFRGDAGRRPLRVDTPLGAVSGRAADFAVDLQPTESAEDSDDPLFDVPALDASLPAFFIVAVLTGQVEVEEADKKVKVSAGESRAFSQEKTPMFAGRIVEISADGKRFTLEGKPSKPGAPPQRRDVSITKETVVNYFGMALGDDRLMIGLMAQATLDKASPENALAIDFGDKSPRLSGTVLDVAADGRSVSLEVYRKGDSPLERKITIDDRTRLSYSGFDKETLEAAVGYQAWVWLAGDSDRATAIRFRFKYKGAAKPTGAAPKTPDKKSAPPKKPEADDSGTPPNPKIKKPAADSKSAAKEKPSPAEKPAGKEKPADSAAKVDPKSKKAEPKAGGN